MEYIDELDIPRVQSLYRGFMRHPPMHWCAAAFVKFEPRAGTAAAPSAGGAKPSETFAAIGGRLLDE